MFHYKYMKALDEKTFLQRVREQTSFPLIKKGRGKHAIVQRGKKRGQMSKAYIDFVKKEKGRVPLLADNIYNPKSKKFLKLSNIIDKRNKKKPKMKQNKQTKDFDLFMEQNSPFLSTYRKLSLEPEFKKLKLNKIKSVKIDLNEFPRATMGVQFIIDNLPNDKSYLLDTGDGKRRVLNDKTISQLVKRITETQDVEESTPDSIDEILTAIRTFDTVTISQLLQGNLIGSILGGSFFNYTVNTSHDLSQFGLFTEVKAENYNENCLINAFKAHDVSIEKINKLKTICKTREIPQRVFTEIAHMMGMNISLSYPLKKSSKNNFNYPMKNKRFTNEYNETIRIGNVDNHYFAIKDTGITTYALEHEEELKHKDNWSEFISEKGYIKRKKRETLRSDTLMKKLLGNRERWLEPITRSQEIYSSTFYDRMRDKPFDDLNYVDADVIENIKIDEEYLEPKERKYLPFFIDFEAFWRKGKNGKEYQQAFMACWVRGGVNEKEQRGQIGCTIGDKCARKMLYKIAEETEAYNKENETKLEPALYAHNMRYDWRHLHPEVTMLSSIEPNGRFINATALFFTGKKKSVNLLFKCTYNMIASPLIKFKKLFKLNVEKEAMPYDVYTEETINKEWINVEECLKHLKTEEQKINFLSNAKKVKDCMIDDEVNINTYAKFYCEKDVEVLYDGYMVFREQIKSVCKELKCKELDILDFNTQAKLANEIITATGCYVGVYKTSGIVQEFISRAIVGGRTMTRNNRKCYVEPVRELVDGKWTTTTRIENRDANSLYPSAMIRMLGFLLGKPKVLKEEQLNLAFLKKQDGYCVDITVAKVPKTFKFPLQSKVVKGIRMFCNDFNIEKNKQGKKVLREICIDNYALQDLIKFHKVKESDIMVKRGYYYNEGFNKKVGEVIKTIYEKRQFYKKQKDENGKDDPNPIEQAYKLIMNSSYGYSMLAPIETELKHIKTQDLDKHIIRNFNYIKQMDDDIDGRYTRVEQYKPIAEHYNNVMCGVQILSMSKTIMNEVMCLVEDLKIPMYYQDTDSIHLDANDAEHKNLNEEYKKLYGKDINGDGLGYFSSDFEVKGCDDEKCYATSGVYLGKKCYYEDVWGVDEKGELHHDPHERMKGVPNGSIIWKAKQLGISVFQLYTRLYRNGGMEFDLLIDENGKDKTKFKFSNDYAISKVNKFKRYITFDDNMREINKDMIFNIYDGGKKLKF